MRVGIRGAEPRKLGSSGGESWGGAGAWGADHLPSVIRLDRGAGVQRRRGAGVRRRKGEGKGKRKGAATHKRRANEFEG